MEIHLHLFIIGLNLHGCLVERFQRKEHYVDFTVRHQMTNKYTDSLHTAEPRCVYDASSNCVDQSVDQNLDVLRHWLNLFGTLTPTISPWFLKI